MFRAGLFCFLPATLPPLYLVVYPVFCIYPVSCSETHIHAFFKSAQKICSKGQKMPKEPLLDISYPFLWGTSWQTLGSTPDISPLHIECERWYDERSGARNMKSCKSCALAFCAKLCTCADSNHTDTGWRVSSQRVSLGPRDDQISHQVLLCCVGSSKKPQGWDERQIGAQGQH